MKEVTLKIKTLEDLTNEELDAFSPIYMTQTLMTTMDYMEEQAKDLNGNKEMRIEDFMLGIAKKTI